MTRTAESWHLTDPEGRAHTVRAGRKHLRWAVRWECDGVEVASKKSFDTTPVLKGGTLGALRLQVPAFPGPAREVALHPAGADEDAALVRAAFAERGDGLQFTPEPGSKAEAGLKWMREHPFQYLAYTVGLTVAGLLVPLLLAALAGLFVWQLNVLTPDIDVPLPAADLPDIPWPDFALPAWVGYVVPVLLAIPFGWAELKRVGKQTDKQNSAEQKKDQMLIP